VTGRLRRLWHLLQTDPSGLRKRAVGLARARLIFRGRDVGPGVAALGAVHLSIEGKLRIGARTTFLEGVIPTDLVVHPGGTLEIGEETLVNYGCSIDATREVRLGARCMLASLIRIADADGLRSGPVIIGDDVWIAHGALIAPGVRVGNGAVIGAGSVVVQDVPAGTMAMGNPARTMPLSMAAQNRAGVPGSGEPEAR
jgi:maltose O-acetyltransferase